MPGIALSPYTHSHQLPGDGSVTFKCSQDSRHWPWLALHPFDPIVVQTVNYWASVETGTARGTFDPTKWSALTQTEWECGTDGAGHAVRGVSDVIGTESEPRFRLTFYDADDALVYRMSGKGVVFHNRDFEGWRAKAKKELPGPFPIGHFDYAPCDATGMETLSQSYLSPLIDGGAPSAQALITKENGFQPGHPYHSGSGDHVNSTHLADAARQFAQLLQGGKALTITGGEMTFKRYVELDRPFDIALAAGGISEDRIIMNIEQSGNFCSAITLGFRES